MSLRSRDRLWIDLSDSALVFSFKLCISLICLLLVVRPCLRDLRSLNGHWTRAPGIGSAEPSALRHQGSPCVVSFLWKEPPGRFCWSMNHPVALACAESPSYPQDTKSKLWNSFMASKTLDGLFPFSILTSPLCIFPLLLTTFQSFSKLRLIFVELWVCSSLRKLAFAVSCNWSLPLASCKTHSLQTLTPMSPSHWEFPACFNIPTLPHSHDKCTNFCFYLFVFFKFLFLKLFILAALGLGSSLWHTGSVCCVGSSSLTRAWTWAHCFGSMESSPLDHQGGPPNA